MKDFLFINAYVCLSFHSHSLFSQDPSLSLLLHDKLQIPSSPRKAWNEHESRCDVCFTHLSQLKQEAVRLVLTCDVSPGSPPSLASLVGTRSLIQGSTPTHLPGSYHSVTPSSSSNSAALASSVSSTCSVTTAVSTIVSNVSISSPHHTKHGTKPNTLGVERKTGSPAHTHPENTWSPAHLSRSNGVTLIPYQVRHVQQTHHISKCCVPDRTPSLCSALFSDFTVL